MNTTGVVSLVDVNKAQYWATNSDSSLPGLIWGHFKYNWYQRVPKIFSLELSILGVFAAVFRLAAITVLASAPFWIDHFSKGTLKPDLTILFIGTLLLAMVYLWAHEKFSVRRRSIRSVQEFTDKLALRLNETVRQITAHINLKDDVHELQRNELIVRVLGCIDHATRAYQKHTNELYFEVSLITFNKDGVHLNVDCRAHSIRSLVRDIPVNDSAAYHVAKAGRDWKALHDLKNDKIFPFKGLAGADKPPYRSMLLIPVIENGYCSGVVTIDAGKPYEFWGGSGSDLTIQLMPYVQLIGSLIDSDKYGIQV